MTERRYIPTPPEAVEAAGRALFGEEWQRDTADLLGWTTARLRQMLRGDRAMPIGAIDDLLRALHAKGRAVTDASRLLEQAVAE